MNYTSKDKTIADFLARQNPYQPTVPGRSLWVVLLAVVVAAFVVYFYFAGVL